MKRKKRTLTLLEIIIVIFLITLITGAIGYNMKGALDKGRSFRTQQGKEQLSNLLLICLEEGENADEIAKNPVKFLRKYDLAKNPDKLIQDGWGQPFQITVYKNKKSFKVVSNNYNNYQKKLEKDLIKDSEED